MLELVPIDLWFSLIARIPILINLYMNFLANMLYKTLMKDFLRMFIHCWSLRNIDLASHCILSNTSTPCILSLLITASTQYLKSCDIRESLSSVDVLIFIPWTRHWHFLVKWQVIIASTQFMFSLEVSAVTLHHCMRSENFSLIPFSDFEKFPFSKTGGN